MAQIDVDLPDDEIVPIGRYRSRVLDPELRTSRSGDEYLNIGFAITAGPHADRRVWKNFSLRPKALYRLKKLLKAAGLPHKGPVTVDTERLTDREVEIQVAHETYQGEKRATVSDVRPIPTTTGRAAPAEPETEIPF